MSTLAFDLPPALEATEPPEERGLRPDDVRLLVAERNGAAAGGGDRLRHARFRDLPDFLRAGDLLVVNVSTTMPAAIDARLPDGTAVRAHFATPAPGLPDDDAWWVVELRTPGGERPFRRGRSGDRIEVAGGASLELSAPYARSTRLWLARVETPEGRSLADHLAIHGAPIRYAHAPAEWPISAYQTVFARESGSAEMPSAARPFTPELVTRLVSQGVLFAPIVLHAGVSSLELNEAPYPERFAVPPHTARLANAVRDWGGRVIAVGTTAVRALESAVQERGRSPFLHAAEGWADTVITPDNPPRAVDGLITGWHEPEASHLHMLEAIAGRDLLEKSYEAALACGYLWHEFGDSHLILR